MEGIKRKIEDLIPSEKNPRIITEKQFNLLDNSLEELGDLSGIVFNARNNTLVGGHMRMKSFEKHNPRIKEEIRYKTPDKQGTICHGFVIIEHEGVSYQHTYREVYWDEITHDKAMIQANKLGGDWDYDILANNWDTEKLEEWGFEKTELIGFSESSETEETDGDDDVPESAPPITVLGDVYDLGTHRLMCGDSTVISEVQTLLNGNKPIVMVTDPPYGVEYDPEWREGVDLGVGERAKGKVKNDDRADWTDAYALFEGDVAYVWHAAKYTQIVAQNLIDCGLEVNTQIIWAKQHFAMSRGDYHWQHEPCWYAIRKGKKHNWQGKRDQSTLWEIKNNNSFGNSDKEETWGHGTQKPLECMLKPVLNNTRRGQSVYDPFGGSGTTLVACEKVGRNCFTMELDEKYCDVIVKRYVDFCKKNNKPYSVFRNGKVCKDFEK